MTMVELPTVAAGKIAVKPYFDSSVENMGLQTYGLSLFDGVAHEEQLACIELNGQIRYLTGLNPFAPEVKMIKDSEEREARIAEIVKTVAALEAELAGNILDTSSSTFWNEVKLLRPDNHDFWGKISIRCSNESLHLDPQKNPYDLIKMIAIEAGGFSIVAKSYEDAKARAVRPKFYLDKEVSTMGSKTEVKKLTNAAISELDSIFKKNPTKLMYIAKVVDNNSTYYKKSTPLDIIYDNLDKYIKGEAYEKNLKRAAESFTEACGLDMETLKVKCIIKDASTYKFVAPKSDGMLYHMPTNSMMGRNVAECIEYLKNPVNDKIFGDLLSSVEKFWKQ